MSKRKDHPSYIKLEKLKELRIQKLLKKLLDEDLKGVEHRLNITKDNRAEILYDGTWDTEYIRTTIVKHNWEVSRQQNWQIKDFEPELILEIEKEET
jgi:serine protease inhibitor